MSVEGRFQGLFKGILPMLAAVKDSAFRKGGSLCDSSWDTELIAGS